MRKYSNQPAFHIIMSIVMVLFFISCGSSGKDVKNDNRISGMATKSNQVIANTHTIIKSDNQENKGTVINNASIDNKLKRSVSSTNQSFSEKTVSTGLNGGKGNNLSHNSRFSPQSTGSANASAINAQNVKPNTQAYSPESKVYASVQTASAMNTRTSGSVMQKGKPNGPGLEGSLPLGDGILILMLLAGTYAGLKKLFHL